MELAVFLERNATHDIAQSGAEKNAQEQIGHRKYEIPEGLPHPVFNMAANLQRNAPRINDQENEKKGLDNSRGESGHQKARKSDKRDAAESD